MQREEIKKTHQKAKQEAQSEEENPFGLMIVNNQQAIEEYMEEALGGKPPEHKFDEAPPSDALIYGFSKGQQMEINKGIK